MSDFHNDSALPEPGSVEARKEAEFLIQMASIYPGDPTGEIMDLVRYLLKAEDDKPELIILSI